MSDSRTLHTKMWDMLDACQSRLSECYEDRIDDFLIEQSRDQFMDDLEELLSNTARTQS